MITGIHHVSMKCCDPDKYREALRFYRDILGLRVYRQWAEGALLDTGAGLIEIFSNGPGVPEKGAVRHFALACDDVDAQIEAVRQAGYEVFIEPNDIQIPAVPPVRARMAFCIGPLGEEIEFFDEKRDGDAP